MRDSDLRLIITALGEDLRGAVFADLDSQFLSHEMTADEAGAIAASVARYLEWKLLKHCNLASTPVQSESAPTGDR